MSVDLRYSFKLPFALAGRHLEQAIVTPPSPQSEAMRKNYKEIIFPVLCVMVIFICAMLCLVAVVDLVVAPILKELLQDSSTRDWCGVFTRCAISRCELPQRPKRSWGMPPTQPMNRFKLSPAA